MRCSILKRLFILAVLTVFPSALFAGSASPVSGRDIRGPVVAADAAAGWRGGKAWSVRLAVENVFDAAYREFFDFSPLRRKGRSVRISLFAGF
jgi:outer membrane receptor protein involved in Fe transport